MQMYETEDFINEQLIKLVQCYPALHSIDPSSEYNNNNKNNEVYWDDIQKKIGIHKSWLKIRWQRIFTDYKKNFIYNHIHNKKVPIFKWAKHLNFIPIDLNGTSDIIFDDFILNNENTFHISQQMLDDCDINEAVTLETVSKCELNTEYEEFPGNTSVSENDTIPKEQHTFNKSLETKKLSEPKTSHERCEDSIFGELVVAMLKKLEPEEKKRAKKEIMNILL